MSAVTIRRITFREACLAVVLLFVGLGLQLACGGHKGAPLAVISTFKSTPAAITPGQGTVLSFTFSGGTGSIDHGVGAVTSGQQVTVAPTTTTTYTLSAVNTDGTATTASTTVSVKAFTGKFVYVANAESGITGFALNDATGVLTELGNSPYDELTDVLHITSDPQGKFLFAVNGDGEADILNTVTVYTINATTGDLTAVATPYATGTDPWSAVVDPTGQFLYVRCSGSISAYAINATTGALTPLPSSGIATSAGHGEVVIHPSGQYLFTVGRTSSTVQVFNVNTTTGALTANGTAYALPAATGPLGLALNSTGEYLFTKGEGTAASTSSACFVYGFRVNVNTGALTALPVVDTGLESSDAHHGLHANPTRPVVYLSLYNSTLDYAAYALNMATGALTTIAGTNYSLFGASGSDSFIVSRNGKWGFLPDYNNARIAVGAIDATTGALGTPTFYGVGNFPVSITVVGTVQ